MLNRDLNAITSEDILRLIVDAVPEGRVIDYKESLHGGGDEDTREFLADVCSFANSGGGDIVFGLRELRDTNGKQTGVPADAPGLPLLNVDTEKLRLENSIRSGIAPRIYVSTRSIDMGQGAPVLVLRIHPSWSTPHMVTFKNLSRFYARNSNGKWQLDVNEIRDAFIASGSVEEKMRSTRLTRILSIGSGETAFRIVDRPKLVTHVMPLERFQNPRNVDGSQLNAAHHALTVPSGNVADLRYNLDGCAGRGRDLMGESFDAIQFFRRGYVEVIDASNSAKAYAEYGFSTLPISKIHLRLFNSIACANAVLMASQLAPPYFVWVTLLGVKNCAIPHWGHGFFSGMPYIQQDSVLLTELMLETVPAEPSQIAKAARPILDELWQASGHPHCPYYDEKGEYFDPERRY